MSESDATPAEIGAALERRESFVESPDANVAVPEIDRPVIVGRNLEFRAGRAAAILGLMLLAQLIFTINLLAVAVLVALVAIYFALLPPNSAVAQMFLASTPIVLLGSVIASGGVAYAATRAWLWNDAGDPTGESFGWKRAERWRILTAALAGVAVGSLFLYGAAHFFPAGPGTKLGPLGRVASRGGASRIAWAVVAVLIAPPVEEFVFRGVLLRGFAASWGLKASAVVVSALFVLSHVPEFVHYWPGAGAITALALGTLAARILSGSLAPAVSFHAAYNLVMVLSLYTLMPG